MDKIRQQKIYELLKRGLKLAENEEELPIEWAREIFPPERREYELVYHGKTSEEQILADTMAVPFQPIKTFGKSGTGWHNKLVFGDNLQAMKTLLQMKERGELVNADGTPGVRLIYIDPPFATKKEFRGSQDQKAYQDKIAGAEFLEFLRKRLVLLKELLSKDGNIYVHLDQKKGHYVKVLMDEIFGDNCFRNEIIWFYPRGGDADKQFNRKHDSIFWYSRSTEKWIFNWEDTLIPYSKEQLARFKEKDERGKFYWNVNPRGERVKTYLRKAGIGEYDVWNIGINAPEIKDIGYPTAKPPRLLERIIKASSNKGDIVLDAFAGSGTACAVAEKLHRRWIGIDSGKLAIYTIQKRMLNLRSEGGKSGKHLQATPFTLYNAGLYDFESLRQLPWEDWRSIALQLFECKDEPHKIHGFKMDGKRQGSSVLVFDHFNKGTISRETISDINASIGRVVGDRCFIIAPRGVFLFQEDYIELDGVRYYALRIPYSYINELHRRAFSALVQPNDEMAVNDIVEAVGFDFIQPPAVELGITKHGATASITIKKFVSRARLRGENKIAKHDALSMVMIDFDYDGKVFDLDRVLYADALKKNAWTIEFPLSDVAGNLMLIFLDMYGNESRVVIEENRLVSRPRSSARRSHV